MKWMKMLNDRADECRATLGPERMAVEAVFRLRDDKGEWIFWFELAGESVTAILHKDVPGWDEGPVRFFRSVKERPPVPPRRPSC
jgi:hypothetical protein